MLLFLELFTCSSSFWIFQEYSTSCSTKWPLTFDMCEMDALRRANFEFIFQIYTQGGIIFLTPKKQKFNSQRLHWSTCSAADVSSPGHIWFLTASKLLFPQTKKQNQYFAKQLYNILIELHTQMQSCMNALSCEIDLSCQLYTTKMQHACQREVVMSVIILLQYNWFSPNIISSLINEVSHTYFHWMLLICKDTKKNNFRSNILPAPMLMHCCSAAEFCFWLWKCLQ